MCMHFTSHMQSTVFVARTQQIDINYIHILYIIEQYDPICHTHTKQVW